jgi:hypothetical protein
MAALNLALRFLLELAGIVTLWFVGWQASDLLALRLLAAFGAAALLALAWAVVVAPKAANPIPQTTRMLIGTVLLLACAAILALSGHPLPAAAFAVVNIVNTIALLVTGGPAESPHADRARDPSGRA